MHKHINQHRPPLVRHVSWHISLSLTTFCAWQHIYLLKYERLPSLKLTARTWKWMVGRLSFRGGLFSGAMLVAWRVKQQKCAFQPCLLYLPIQNALTIFVLVSQAAAFSSGDNSSWSYNMWGIIHVSSCWRCGDKWAPAPTSYKVITPTNGRINGKLGIYTYIYNPCKWSYFTLLLVPLCRIFTTFLCCLIDSAVKCLGLIKNRPTKQLEVIFCEKLKWLAVKRYVSRNAIHSTPYLQNRVVYRGLNVGNTPVPLRISGTGKWFISWKQAPVFQSQKYVLFVGSTHLKNMQNPLKNCRERETILSCWFSGPIFQGDVAVSLISNSQLKYWLEWRKRRGQQKHEEKSSI